MKVCKASARAVSPLQGPCPHGIEALLPATLQLPEQTSNGVQEVTEVAAVYDLDANSYAPIRIREAPFCAGHIYGPLVRSQPFMQSPWTVT